MLGSSDLICIQEINDLMRQSNKTPSRQKHRPNERKYDSGALTLIGSTDSALQWQQNMPLDPTLETNQMDYFKKLVINVK